MVFTLISTIIGVLGGILAMSSLFVGKSPQAAQQLEKLAKYQGWIGLTMFGWGVWELIDSVLLLGQIALGIFTVLTFRAVPLAVGHFAGAASLWALWMSAWLMTRRRQREVVIDIPEARLVAA